MCAVVRHCAALMLVDVFWVKWPGGKALCHSCLWKSNISYQEIVGRNRVGVNSVRF